MAARPAVTIVPLESKRVGAELRVLHPIGTRCKVERSSLNAGEFVIWFPRQHYVKLDAVKVLDVIQYTDNRRQL